MTETPPTQFRTGALSPRKPTRFRLTPDKEGRAAMAESLGLQGLYDLTFQGEIAPSNRSDFTLTGQVRAEAVQSCVVTLAPVPAKIDEPVIRRYLADFITPDGEEAEMPEDDSSEPLPEVIDLIEVLREALALALPQYPRAPGAELGEAVFAAPGAAPIRDADLRPFAALASLVRKDAPAKD